MTDPISALDEAMDHAAMIGAKVEVLRVDIAGNVSWTVRLNDESSGFPEGHGATVEGAAGALMFSIEQHLESLRAALPFTPDSTPTEPEAK